MWFRILDCGNDEMRRNGAFRGDSNDCSQPCLLAGPSDMLIRGPDAATPEYRSHGAMPKRPFPPFDHYRDFFPDCVWPPLTARDGLAMLL